MNDRHDTLLNAVDDLTLPRRTKVMQDDKTVTIELPGLLQQLEQAIRGSSNTDTGSGSLANERNPINVDALWKAATINAAIRDWCRLVNVDARPPDKPWELLSRWYVAYTLRNPEEDAGRFYFGQCTKWAHEIEAMLDPPKQLELPDPCPYCGAGEWVNESDGLKYGRPLIIQYKADAPDLVGDAKVLCRACRNVWGAREVAYAIEQKEQDTA
jgi:hypothetical protein